MKRSIRAAWVAVLLFTSIVGLGSAPDPARAAVTVSSVDTSKTTYDKYALMVDGKPFFHSGVQFRYEKHKYTYGWTDAQLEPVLKMISDDGFSVVNIPSGGRRSRQRRTPSTGRTSIAISIGARSTT